MIAQGSSKSAVERLLRGALVAFMIALFSGTIADQVTRNFTHSANVVAEVWVTFAVISGYVYRTKLRGVSSGIEYFELAERTRHWVGRIAILAAIAAVILTTLPHASTVFIVAKVVAILIAIGGAVGYWLASEEPKAQIGKSDIMQRVNSRVLGGCAFVAALLASMTYRTSTDDFYYVNLSTYIFDKGQIPVRDTVLSDQYFNGYARMSSWEVLWGVFARITHIHVALLLYVVFIPLAAALSIYVLAKLMESMGIRHLNLALIASTIFLAFDGVQGFTFGSYQGPRIWQGKSFFLAVLIPLLSLLILNLLRSGSKVDAIILIGATVASLGATTTTFIIGLPMLAAGLFIALMNRNRIQSLAFSASIAYLLATAVLFKRMLDAENTTQVSALGRGAGVIIRTAKYSTHDDIPQSFDLLTKLSGPTWHATLFAFAAVVGWIALRGNYARQLVALYLAAWGFISSPGIVQFYTAATGSAPIAWRYIWLIPIPLLVGATASVLYDGIWYTSTSQKIRTTTALTWVALLAVLPMTLGTPPWKIAPGSRVSADLTKPGVYRVGFGYPQAEKALRKVAKEHDIVLARNGISASINSRTTRYFTVGLRHAYVEHATNGFKNGFPKQRIALATYVGNLEDKPTLTDAKLARDLRLVRVNVVCISKEQSHQIPTFKALGYIDKQAKVSKSDGRIWVWCGRTNAYDN